MGMESTIYYITALGIIFAGLCLLTIAGAFTLCRKHKGVSKKDSFFNTYAILYFLGITLQVVALYYLLFIISP